MSHITFSKLRRYNLLHPFLKNQILEEVLSDQIIPEKTFCALRDRFILDKGLDGAEDFKAYLISVGLTEEDFNWQIMLRERVKSYSAKHFSYKAEAQFLSRKNHLDTIVYSLLRVQDRFLARELYLQIEAGEASFGELAAKFSEGPERLTNGICGPSPLTKAHPSLAEKLRYSNVGELIQPFPAGNWCLVARIESYEPAVFDEETSERMSIELFDEFISDETSSRMKSIMGDLAKSI